MAGIGLVASNFHGVWSNGRMTSLYTLANFASLQHWFQRNPANQWSHQMIEMVRMINVAFQQA